MKKQLTDESIMPWGKHKGAKMIDVPASYLIFMYNEKKVCPMVKEYIEDNLDVLNEEIKRENAKIQRYGNKNFD